MLKSEIIPALKVALKEKGFKKVRNYWYKSQHEMTFYLNVQGSAYCSEDFYVNLGIVFSPFQGKIPQTYEWDIRRRVFVDNKEINLDIQDVLSIFCTFLNLFPTLTEAKAFAKNQKKQYQHIIISDRYQLI
jgi:putative IMPACT (imprinted ancient) family translation regulator